MSVLHRLRVLLVIAGKRLVAHPGLAAATILGLAVAVAVMMSIPIYAEATSHRMFVQSIAPGTVRSGEIPPSTFLFRYDGSIHGARNWKEFADLDHYLTYDAGPALNLSLHQVVRYVTTEPFGLFADEASSFENAESPLDWVSLGFVSGLEERIMITEGRFPEAIPDSADTALEILVHEDLASQLGAQAGETYIAFIRTQSDDGSPRNVEIPVRFAGFWLPTDPRDTYWFYAPQVFTERLLVSEEAFVATVSSELTKEVYTAVWHLVFDGQDIHHASAGPLIRRTRSVQQRAATLLPNVSLARSPLEALLEYQRSVYLLTLRLYAFSIPIVGLIFAFIILTASLSTDRQRNEIAVLRSRGAQISQMIGAAALEGSLQGALALAISLPISIWIASVIGQTHGFMDFDRCRDTLHISATPAALRFGLLAVMIGVAAQLLPALDAAHQTIVSHRWQRCRILRRPWWQRVWLDLLLLLPAGYGAYLLRNQGRVAVLASQFDRAPFENPLLFLVPALGLFALTLVSLRLLPLLMWFAVQVAARRNSVAPLMAARHLARTPGLYTAPLILLVFTLSLAMFTASLAYTLDRHLQDKVYYRVGADLRFVERGEVRDLEHGVEIFEPSESAAPTPTQLQWHFLPATDYLQAPGIRAVARVATYPAVPSIAPPRQNGVYMGLDRAAFPQISYWRSDFASDSLGALMNQLAKQRAGVLVPETFLEDSILRIGDIMQIEITAHGQRTVMDLTIVGAFHYFPTWYPSEGPLFIGDLDYFFEQAGQQLPYEVWTSLSPETNIQQLVDEHLALFSYDWIAPSLMVAEQQDLPERQGLFGVLSIGFSGAAMLTVVGFLLCALHSFQRRAVEFGVLRAIGASKGQMAAMLAWELGALILIGGGLGTVLGGFVSRFYIPYLQIGVEEAAQVPPYIVDIAWLQMIRVYLLFGGLFVVALLALVMMLQRLRIIEAVKLGDSA